MFNVESSTFSVRRSILLPKKVGEGQERPQGRHGDHDCLDPHGAGAVNDIAGGGADEERPEPAAVQPLQQQQQTVLSSADDLT